MAVVACAGFAYARSVKAVISAAIVVVAAVGAIGMLLQHVDAGSTCVADYPGGARIIGREYTPDGAAYVRTTGTVSPRDLLLDVAGDPERIWTGPSIARCRFWVGWGGLLPIALLAVCVAAIVARPGSVTARAPAARRPRHRRAPGRRSTTRSSATATPSPTRPTRCRCWRRSNRAACGRPSTSATSAPTSTSSPRWSAASRRAASCCASSRRATSTAITASRRRSSRRPSTWPSEAGENRTARVRAGRPAGLAARPGGDRLHGVRRTGRAGRAAARPGPGAC